MWEKTFRWLEFDENYRVYSVNYEKRVEVSSEDWWGLDYQTIH